MKSAHKKLIIFGVIALLVVFIGKIVFSVETDLSLYLESVQNEQRADVEKKAKRYEDKEFEKDSKIRIKELSDVQVDNLYVLCKVWGYVKYRHPSITNGDINWDAELFRVMPDVLNAESKEAGNKVIAKWLNKFPFEIKELSVKEEKEYQKNLENELWRVDMSWIEDEALVGKDASNYLVNLSRVKKIGNLGYAVHLDRVLVEDTSWTNFLADNQYNTFNYEDSGIRLLGLFRYWNTIEYFYGNAYLHNEDWNKALYEKIPEVATGKDMDSYTLSMANLISKIHDTHAVFPELDNVISRQLGRYTLPAIPVNIDGQIVVEKVMETDDLKPGDVILSINDTPMSDRIEFCKKYYSTSDDGKFINAYKGLLYADKENVKVKIIRDGKEEEVSVRCILNRTDPYFSYKGHSGFIEGENIGYIQEFVTDTDGLDKYMEKFKDTDGIIIDMRYQQPSIIYAVVPEYILPTSVKAALNYAPNPYIPGSFSKAEPMIFGKNVMDDLFKRCDSEPLKVRLAYGNATNNGLLNTLLGKAKDRYSYKGKVIVLVDERTQSKFEITSWTLGKGENVTVIGTNTVGATGSALPINIPGNGETYFSQCVTFEAPNNKQTQVIGVTPDIEVKETVEGLSEGRNELIDEAVKIIKNK